MKKVVEDGWKLYRKGKTNERESDCKVKGREERERDTYGEEKKKSVGNKGH